MARPRVFLSSTYYDLKYVRDDLDVFVRDLGYDPVRHEVGSIAYGSKEAPEKYAYKEVGLCDVLVCVVGGRLGSESRDEGGSITQTEVKYALENGIQVFILIDNSVYIEYQTYLLNKQNEKTKYRHVDDVRVFEFIEHLYSLPNNNPIFPFSSSKEIIGFLREQWAGLFQRFLSEQRRVEEVRVLSEMKSIASTLKQLVDYLSSEKKGENEAVKDILSSNHPAFSRIADLTGTKYRLYFLNRGEFESWLAASGFRPVKENALDDDSVEEWAQAGTSKYLKLTHAIFDEAGSLIPFSADEWKDSWLTLGDY